MVSTDSNSTDQTIKICLSIAGLDPSSGAGIIADARTFTAFGCFPLAVATALTFQNTQGVFGTVNQTAETVSGQIEPLIDDFKISAIKTGMLPTDEIVKTVAELIEKNKLENLVVDPVLRSTSGYSLINKNAAEALIRFLFPLATIVTPNIPEAEILTGIKIMTADDVRQAAKMIKGLGAKSVVIKGGHLLQVDENQTVIDYLLSEENEIEFSGERLESRATHGTGCTFASAIAACLAKGKSLEKSVETAKKFVSAAIASAPLIGHGHSPVNQSIEGFNEF